MVMSPLYDKRPVSFNKQVSQDTEPKSIHLRYVFQRDHVPYDIRHFNNYSQCPALE